MSDCDLLTGEDLDAFAAVIGEERFVDLDVERAKQTLFGGTIARGYYTRSLGRTSRRGARRRRSRRRLRCACCPRATA